MDKIIKQAEHCQSCGNVVKHEEHVQVCDACGKQLDWNSQTGYPFSMHLYHHYDECVCKSNMPEWHFCSMEEAITWLKTNYQTIVKDHPNRDWYWHLDFNLHADHVEPFILLLK